ncbi:hypothetical protein IM40_08840 [Candidatus Paracaedimonas acanthamoebae]|nr:hypothetical protein IM40_08840 [Candidatus Paracaedimonas acanthamoebae]
MIKTHEQKPNGKKELGAQKRLDPSTIKKRVLSAVLRRETGCFNPSQRDKRMKVYQQSFNRWWDLIFDQGSRKRMAIGNQEMCIGTRRSYA